MKTCRKCLLDKPISDFYKNKRNKDGLTSYCKYCNNIKAAEWAKNNNKKNSIEVNTKANIRRHRITIEKYNSLLAAQNNVCAICSGDGGSRRLNIDHDHKCCPGLYSCGNCVRGLLCGSCNKAIGALKEDRAIMLRVLDYLQL